MVVLNSNLHSQLSSDESADEKVGSSPIRIVENSVVSGKAAEDAASSAAGTLSGEGDEGRIFGAHALITYLSNLLQRDSVITVIRGFPNVMLKIAITLKY